MKSKMNSGRALCPSEVESLMNKLTRDCSIQFAASKKKKKNQLCFCGVSGDCNSEELTGKSTLRSTAVFFCMQNHHIYLHLCRMLQDVYSHLRSLMLMVPIKGDQLIYKCEDFLLAFPK